MVMYIMFIEYKVVIYFNLFCKIRNKGNVIRKKKKIRLGNNVKVMFWKYRVYKRLNLIILSFWIEDG